MRKRWITYLISAAALAAVPLHASSVFVNGDVSSGTTTPFSDTSKGVTALFSSNGDPSGFMVVPSFFGWGPESLVSTNFNLTLTIEFFSDPGLVNPLLLSGISMDFGTFDNLPLILNAFTGGPGGSLVGSNSALGTFNPSTNAYEGVIGFSGGLFDTITLKVSSSDTGDSFGLFGVGNITVPEPGYFWAFPTLAAGLGVWKRRRVSRRLASLATH